MFIDDIIYKIKLSRCGKVPTSIFNLALITLHSRPCPAPAYFPLWCQSELYRERNHAVVIDLFYDGKQIRLMNALLRQTARVSDAVAEAAALRLNFPRLASVTAGPDGALCLAFLNLAAETKFSATLRLGAPPVSESKLASVQNIVTNGSAVTPGRMHGTEWNRSHCFALWDEREIGWWAGPQG